MKRARDDMVHVYNAVSGEEWATVSTEDFPTVRSLKQHLEGFCGVSRFRQRLLLGETTLQDDAKLGSSDLRLVLQAIAKTSKRQANELTRSVKQGSIQRVEEILQRPQDPDLTDQNGRTPLYIASLRGNRSIVQLLLEARASVEKRYTIKIERDGAARARSALGAAVQEGHEDVARLLLQAMANPNKFGGNYYCGVSETYDELGRYCPTAFDLLDDLTMPALRTPLWRATRDGKEPIVRLLLMFSADANKVSSDTFSTPLGVACLQNRLQIVRLLLEARADKDAVLWNVWRKAFTHGCHRRPYDDGGTSARGAR